MKRKPHLPIGMRKKENSAPLIFKSAESVGLQSLVCLLGYIY